MAQLIPQRIYSHDSISGYRILTDRLWPRGISKEKAALDLWAKEIAPTNELRKWFSHDPAKFPEFKQRYLAELAANDAAPDFVNTVREQLTAGQDVLLLFGAKDEQDNQAIVLQEWLKAQL
jgi:uncharacterized protein YeaO (DUF488 family)